MTLKCEFGCDGGGFFPDVDGFMRVCLCHWLSLVGMPKALHGKRFDTFTAGRADSQLERVIAWAENYHDGVHSLLLYSDGKGTGKTHLMSAAAIRVIRHHKRSSRDLEATRFYLAPRLFEDITSNPEAFNDRLDTAMRATLLFLDDVGQGDEGDPAWLRAKKRDAWFRLFSHREMQGLTTVATSNLDSVAKLADVLGEAATDRFMGMTGKPGRIKFDGITSYRLREEI